MLRIVRQILATMCVLTGIVWAVLCTVQARDFFAELVNTASGWQNSLTTSNLRPLFLTLAGALVILIVTQVLRLLLRRLERAALSWGRLTANDKAVRSFFSLLSRAISSLAVLVFGWCTATWFGAEQAVAYLSFALRTVPVAFLAALSIRAFAALVDSADALASKYAAERRPLRHYPSFRKLVPLLRRCIEAVIWLAAASVIIVQVRPAAQFAIYGPLFIQVVAIFFVSRVVAEAATLAVGNAGSPEGLSDLEVQQRATIRPIVASGARSAVYFVGIVLTLYVLGINPLPLLAGAGVVGIVLGLGAQTVINDLVSGFFILSESQFLVGDYVEAGNARGSVEAIHLRTTRIRDPNGQLHIVRNGQMSNLVNYSKSYTFAVVEIELPIDADLVEVELAIEEAAMDLERNVPDVIAPTTMEGVEGFSQSSIVLRTSTKVRPGTHGLVARQLRGLLIAALRRRGCLLPPISSKYAAALLDHGPS